MSDIPPDLLAPPPGALAVSDAPGLPLTGPQWGIFNQDGSPVLTADSFGSVEYARDYHISDYPQEQGKFESYNKVKVPYHTKVGFLISTTRTDFLNAVEAAVGSLNFVTVVTPEITYASANLTHYNYRRDAQHGRSLIRVDVWCEEIRVVSGATTESAQSTNAADPAQGGDKQPVGTTTKDPPATGNDPTNDTENFTGSGFTAPAPSPPSTDPTDTENFLGPNPNPPLTNSQLADRMAAGGFGAGVFGKPVTTIPPGVPNSTGGGANWNSTSLNDAVIGSTPGPGGF